MSLIDIFFKHPHFPTVFIIGIYFMYKPIFRLFSETNLWLSRKKLSTIYKMWENVGKYLLVLRLKFKTHDWIYWRISL